MGWDLLVGQERVKRLLRNALAQRRMAHAYLFTGPEGCGKSAAAMLLAAAVNCERGGDEAPCGACRSCRAAAALRHPDIALITALPAGKGEKAGDGPIEKLAEDDLAAVRAQFALKAEEPYHRIAIPRANTIKVSSIREIRRASSLSPFGARRKVFLILDADAMNDEAANALLKTLEEPAGDTLLILTSSRADLLLPTIVSRCQQIRFDPLGEEAIAAALRAREECDAETAMAIARLAQGSYTRALGYLHAGLGGRREEALELLRTMMFRTRAELAAAIERIGGELEKDETEELLKLLQHWLRDAMLLSAGTDLRDRPQGQTSAADETLSKIVTRYPRASYAEAIADVDEAISLLAKNVYIPLVVLNLARALRRHIDPPTARGAS